ncbi:MAG: hypothetical protein AYP45_05775 [Candidatus Brocadia carolinensis]|uniref:Uncharacterized protein n=1 Tax=Candidatus Brocadia carolinensis TaxID=1004156 RepID=A0A1V4AV83_9BACT|nr:MAG: hypothetical protein AYP45_05775 [Candidatus Brocadia caroliniensis]
MSAVTYAASNNIAMRGEWIFRLSSVFVNNIQGITKDKPDLCQLPHPVNGRGLLGVIEIP